MKVFLFLFQLILVSASSLAQSSICHTIVIDPIQLQHHETIEIETKAEYLLRIEKDQIIDDDAFSIYPKDYKRLDGEDFDLLLFDSPKIKIEKKESLPKTSIQSNSGIQTVSLELRNNYLRNNQAFDYDPHTNSSIQTKLFIKGDFEVLGFRCFPDITKKTISGNQIEFNGNLNQIRIEVDFSPLKHERSFESKNAVVEKKIKFNNDVTLTVWDDVQEDGDVISIWLGSICLAKRLKVSKEKVSYRITKEMFGGEKSLIIRIDNVDDGSIPPNTVLVHLQGDGVDETLNIHTTDQLSKEIILWR